MADENNPGEEVGTEQIAGEATQAVESAAAPAEAEAVATPEVETPSPVAEESVAEVAAEAEVILLISNSPPTTLSTMITKKTKMVTRTSVH